MPVRVVSVRVEESDLRKLQLIAQVQGGSVGELIRTAIKGLIETVSSAEDFQTKALEVQKQTEETLRSLFEKAEAK